MKSDSSFRDTMSAVRLVLFGNVHRTGKEALSCVGAAIIITLALPAVAQDRPGGEDCRGEGIPPPVTEVRAFRTTGPIKLDGRLDETDWQRSSAAPLIQNDPRNGCPPSQRTDWWVVYDDEALYVAGRLWESAPDSIASRLGRRDSYPASDMVVLCLDPFNDDRTGYLFSLTPAGARGDATLYNDGWDDPSWDGIWEAASRIDEGGWAVEIRVPFSQLCFPDRPEQVWGINFSRRILRNQERDDLYFRPRDESGAIRRYPNLIGIAGVVPSSRRELLAYGASRGEFLQPNNGDPFRDGSAWRGDAGADLKWGLSNQLALNATINPDFGQVEVDPAVVNLSDFETFFEERRPFFVEQANLFRYGGEGTNSNWNFNWMDPLPFYSRRIGRAPQIDLPDHDFADVPGATTILGAGKLGGKVGRTEVGFLSAVTARERADLRLGDASMSQIVEPATGYGVLRLKQSAADGRRGLGAMLTGVRRDLEGDLARESLARDAVTAGLDGWLALDSDRTWAMRGYLSASRVAGDAAAVDALQRSSRRYLHRPGLDHFGYDPTRTSLSGWCGRLMVNKESGNLMLNSSVGAISPGYDVNEVGFSNRADYLNWHLSAGRRWLEPTRTFRGRTVNLATYRSWDYGGNPDNYGYGGFVWMEFTNYCYVEMSAFYNPDRASQRATRGGPAMRLPASRSLNWYGRTDHRRDLGLEANGEVWRADDGSEGFYISTGLEYRPPGALRVSMGPSMSWSHDRAHWVDNVGDPAMTATYGTRHVFADLDYREFGLTTRVDWTFTPQLTLQTYVQPLFAVANYRELLELARPSSYDFNRYGTDNGSTIDYATDPRVYTIDPDGAGAAEPFTLDDPDFNFKSLKINLVLRWEYRPGSTAFLVWAHNRTNSADPGRFRLGSDARALLDSPGDNVVMLKITNWFQI